MIIISLMICCLSGCSSIKGNGEKVELRDEIVVEVDGSKYLALPFDAEDCEEVDILSYSSAPPFPYFKNSYIKKNSIRKIYSYFDHIAVEESEFDSSAILNGGFNVRVNFILRDKGIYTIQCRPKIIKVYGLTGSENMDDLDAVAGYKQIIFIAQIDVSEFSTIAVPDEMFSTYHDNND